MSDVIICPTCKGRGTVPDWLSRVATMGLILLFGEDDRDRNKCPTCKGMKFVKIPDAALL